MKVITYFNLKFFIQLRKKMKSSYYYSPPNHLTTRTAIEAESAVPALVYFYIIMIVHMGIASVIFQEKYHGIFADAKNLIALIYAGGVHYDSPGTKSYGLAEMQIKLAGELLGIDSNVTDGKAKIYEALLNDETSIGLLKEMLIINLR